MINRALEGKTGDQHNFGDFSRHAYNVVGDEPGQPHVSGPIHLHFNWLPSLQTQIVDETQIKSLKSLVQQIADKRGILFRPISRNLDGHAFYQFANEIISIQNDVIYRKQGDNYIPCSLNDL